MNVENGGLAEGCTLQRKGRRCGQEQARMDGERRTPASSAVAVREGRRILPQNREEELVNECGVKRKEA